jgi:hypothetical protein
MRIALGNGIVAQDADNREVIMERRRWEYLAVPLKDAGDLKKGAEPLRPERLNALGAEGWEAVGLSLKRGDLVAWPVVLLKRALD